MNRLNENLIKFIFIFYIGLNAIGYIQIYAKDLYKKEVYIQDSEIQIRSNIKSTERPGIDLVLSGGGARGLIHIGVIRALEENNIPVHMIVGTSIGSVIGGLYASGYTCDEIVQILKSVNWDDIYRDSAQRTTLFPSQKDKRDRYLLSVRFNGLNPYIPSSITPGQKILSFLSEQILKAPYQVYNDFNDLKIPFRTVATDLVSGRQIVLKDGNLAEAINASLAVPLLFSAIEKDSMLLVDGGLRSNLPVQAAINEGARKIVAVDVTARLREKDDILVPWKLVDQATTIMSASSTVIDRNKADIVIQPVLEEFPSDRFDDIDELARIGWEATEKQIEKIKDLSSGDINEPDTIFNISSTTLIVNNKNVSLTDFPEIEKYNAGKISKYDILNILDTLLNFGYYQSVQAEIKKTNETAQLIFKLEEYPKIENLFIFGNEAISGTKIHSIISTEANQRLNYVTLQNDLKNIINLYREKGYSLTTIKDIIWNKDKRSLSIVLEEGKINSIEIEGNESTRSFVIDREFEHHKGKIFNWKSIQQSIQNVYATELFERVSVDVVKKDSSTNLLIKVHEKAHIVGRFGGKYDSDRRMQAYMEISNENLWGTGVQTDILARLGMRDGNIGLGIINDRIFLSNFNFGLKVYHTWEINPVNMPGKPVGRYREERTGLRIHLGRQVRRLGQLIAEFRQENITDKKYSGQFDNSQNIEIRTLKIKASSDERDRRDFPRSGIYNHWEWESGNRLVFETDESFTKALINLEGYYTYHNYHTMRLKLFVGIGDQTLPFSELFRLGGLHSFYGLAENEYYGRQLFSTSAEYRYKLPFHTGKNNLLLEDIYLLIRYDFAGIWENPEFVFESEDFFSALGGAIALDTFLGPFYIGYGRTTRGNAAAYVSIGLNF